MYTEMYIGREEKSDKKKWLKVGGTILWILMIGIVLLATGYSL